MELNELISTISLLGIKNIFFIIFAILFAVFYFFYAIVVSKQVKIMDKAMQDEHNPLILFITSLQVTASLIILIVVLLSLFLV